MANSPYFSIIVPTLNSANTLFQAIQSVIEQQFQSYEILIMDGGSRDATVSIAQGFNDGRIIISREKDAGIYDAMNKGILRAKGNWLYFLGSDDALADEEVLKKISLFISAHEVDVVYGNVRSTRLGETYDGEFDGPKIRRQNICHQAIFFNKSIFPLIGDFDLSFKALSDWDHNFKWFFNKRVRHKYMNLIVAEYAEGGFSSVTSDARFMTLMNWQYMKAQRNSLSFSERLFFCARQSRQLFSQRKFSDLMRVVSESPKFIF